MILRAISFKSSTNGTLRCRCCETFPFAVQKYVYIKSPCTPSTALVSEILKNAKKTNLITV